VRWLLLKDLQILRRSPLLVGMLVVYPVVIALLIGLALSRGPARPRVAVLNELGRGQATITLGSRTIDANRYARQLFDQVDVLHVQSREQALAKVRSGDALAALVIPPDITQKLSTGLERPTVEVIVNNSDPLKAQFVDSTIRSKLADANAALSHQFTGVALQYINLLLTGGQFSLFGGHIDVLGLERARTILRATQASLPRGSLARAPLGQVIQFATLAIDNLSLSNSLLASLSQPIAVHRTTVNGSRTPLDAFAVAVAVAVSLMFVTVLLAAGMLALEREENAFLRLVRGLVSRLALVSEKVGLAALCSFAVTLLMLMGIGLIVGLDWGRFPLWLLALGLGAVSFAALGVAIGGVAREVRAASLLAFLLSLPLAFLALVPSGSVSSGLYQVIRVVSAAFPFKPALEALNAAINGAQPGIGMPLLHLAILAVVFVAIARLALRRFA
jgi:ABC-2 type transport system permease protein